MGKYFNEKLIQVYERRHEEELYLPMAIYIEELRDQISKRVPDGTPIPCSETVHVLLKKMPLSILVDFKRNFE